MRLAECELRGRRVAVLEDSDGTDREVPRIQHQVAGFRIQPTHAQHGESAEFPAFEVDVEVEREVLRNERVGIGEREVIPRGIVIVCGRLVLRAGRKREEDKKQNQAVHVSLDGVGEAGILLQAAAWNLPV